MPRTPSQQTICEKDIVVVSMGGNDIALAYSDDHHFDDRAHSLPAMAHRARHSSA